VSSRTLVSLRVAATAQRAFAVFTQEIGAWWTPNSLFRFTPRSPGHLSFEARAGGRFIEMFADSEVFEIGDITAWEPGRRLAFSWRQAAFTPQQITHVEVRFELFGSETRVTVEHSGWESYRRSIWPGLDFQMRLFLRGMDSGGKLRCAPCELAARSGYSLRVPDAEMLCVYEPIQFAGLPSTAVMAITTAAPFEPLNCSAKTRFAGNTNSTILLGRAQPTCP